MVTEATVERMRRLYAEEKQFIDNAIEFSSDNFERGYMMLIRDIAMGLIKPTDSVISQQPTVAQVAI